MNAEQLKRNILSDMRVELLKKSETKIAQSDIFMINISLVS